MLVAKPLSADIVVRLKEASVAYDAALLREVDSIWSIEKCSRGKHLFNGDILTVTSIDPSLIEVSKSQYKFFLAQMRHPELYSKLKVRMLAVSGLTLSIDKILLGRRAANLTQNPGQWELVPSGGVEPSEAKANGEIDCTAQILKELREETGINPQESKNPHPFLLVEDSETHLTEVCYELQVDLNELPKSDSREYANLLLVPKDELQLFFEKQKRNFVPLSIEILKCRHHITVD